MAKTVKGAHYVSLTDIHTFDWTPLVNIEKLLNKMEQFDAIIVWISTTW